MTKYLCWYNSIISKAKNRVINGYTEKHHIIPRSLGGSDEEVNLVSLTSREHFICHLLLTKIYSTGTFEWYKMNHAFMFMTASKNGKRYVNSRLYDYAKKNFSKAMSYAQSGNKNSQHGTTWIVNIDLRKNRKIPSNELQYWLEIGWTQGRIADFQKYFSKLATPPKIKKINQKSKEDAEHYWNLYNKLQYNSIRKFVRDGHYPYSHVALTQSWKKYISNYNTP